MLGKILGGVIAWYTLGPLWAIAGVLVGHMFDKGRSKITSGLDSDQRKRIERSFFSALFPLLGQLAKADGRVSEDEISSVEDLMREMGLDAATREKAIALFKTGIESNYSSESALDEFVDVCGKHRELKQIFLVYLITLAYADAYLHEREEDILAHVAERLGYSRFAFNQLMGMVKAQSFFYRGDKRHHSGSRRQSKPDELKLAYQALGVTPQQSDQEIKRAYRKLMSESHPDKLAGKGVPEDVIKLATERSQEIQAAYELVKKSRK